MTPHLEYYYWMNEDGTHLYKDGSPIDGTHYQTDKVADDAVAFIQDAQEPFFLYAVPSAPHLDPGADYPPACDYVSDPTPHWPWGWLPTIRTTHDGAAAALDYDTLVKLAKPNWNEDTIDKPQFLDPDHLTEANHDCIAQLWYDRLEALKSIDEMLGRIKLAIEDKDGGSLQKTVIIFTSDNGYYNGEQRLHQKIGAYEDGIRVPLGIRYPALHTGFGGTTLHDYVINTDLGPTIAALGAVNTPDPLTTNYGVDGQSWIPLLKDGTAWPRLRFLVEHWKPVGPSDETDAEGTDFYPDFFSIRTGPGGTTGRDPANVLYTVLTGPFPTQYEFYDLVADPYQTSNGCKTGLSCPGDIDNALKTYLSLLEGCDAKDASGFTCPDLENDPDGPP